MDAVQNALAGLASRERMLLLCRFRDGLKLREIAEFFGMKDANAAARALYGALDRLEPLRTFDATARLGEAERDALQQALRDRLFRLREASDGEA